MRTLRNVEIIGTGSYAPKRVVANDFFDRVGSSDSWIQKNLGIKERHIANGEATSDLAAEAAVRAIESANLSTNDVDLILVATATPDRPAPSTACFVQDKIKAYRAAAFDVAAVCSGALFAMSVGAQYIASGMYNRVLVIGADTFSKITDWDRRDSVFFGDGAGAVLLSGTEEDNRGFLAYRLHSDGRGKFNFTVPAGGSESPASAQTLAKRMHYFQMNGKEVYKKAVDALPKVINEVIQQAGISPNDIDYMIPHQPSIRILEAVAEKVGLPFEKVMTNMDKYANTSGGTIPILLDEVNQSGRLKKGDLLLFAAIGAGWTWGASLLRW